MAEPAVQLNHVSLQRQGRRILDDINWSLPRGAVAAILGPNGSGKTTLIRTLCGYEWPTNGAVHVLGHTLGRIDIRLIRQRVQIVDPNPRFGVDPSQTALNVALTGYHGSLTLYHQPTGPQRDRAAQLLRAVGLADHLHQSYHLLSTGEQRRCLLARAMVRLPEILILDEPTAGLDVNAREHLLATIDQLHRLPNAPTVITVTHHVEEVTPATDHVLLLKAGRIVAQGTPRQVFTPEQLSRLFDCRLYVQKRSGRYWLEVLPEAWLDLLSDKPQA